MNNKIEEQYPELARAIGLYANSRGMRLEQSQLRAVALNEHRLGDVLSYFIHSSIIDQTTGMFNPEQIEDLEVFEILFDNMRRVNSREIPSLIAWINDPTIPLPSSIK